MITDVVARWAKAQPDRIALICNDVPLSYAAFAGAISTARRFLAARCPAGRIAVVLIADLRHSWIAVLALRTLGFDTICVQSTAQALVLRLKDVACLVVTDAAADRQSLRDPRPDVPVIVLPQAILNDGTPSADPLPHGFPAAGGHILHTSGSTGERKKLLLDAASEDGGNANRAAVLGYDERSVHHGIDYGLWTGVGYKQPLAVWHVGGRVVLDQRPEGFARFFAHGVNRARLLPPMLRDLLDQADLSLKSEADPEISSGGSMVPPDLAKRALATLTRNFTITYSATELSASALEQRFHAAEDLVWLSPRGGRVVQVVDQEGTELRPGEEGALRISLNGFDCTSYLDEPGESARAFRGGFFYPNDLAVRRADGRIRVLGRLDDVIDFGGQKMATAPLEENLQRALRVAEVCLFARARSEGGQELVIALETDRELPPHELGALEGEFSNFAAVRVEVLPRFPRTESGTRKVRRLALKRMLFSDGDIGASEGT